MKMVKLGRTGLDVSRICLGMMTYGSPEWRAWVLDEAAARPLVRRAVEAGVNFFDTADMYSNGASEIITGKLPKEFAKRDEIVIATKVFYQCSTRCISKCRRPSRATSGPTVAASHASASSRRSMQA